MDKSKLFFNPLKAGDLNLAPDKGLRLKCKVFYKCWGDLKKGQKWPEKF